MVPFSPFLAAILGQLSICFAKLCQDNSSFFSFFFKATLSSVNSSALDPQLASTMVLTC